MNDVPPSQSQGEGQRRLSVPSPLAMTGSLLIRRKDDNVLTDSSHFDTPAPAYVVPPDEPRTPEEQIQRLREEIGEYQQSLEQWTRAEIEWGNQRRLFKVMTGNVTDLVVLVDHDGNRVWNNPAYSDALGRDTDEFAGTYVLSEVHPDDRNRANGAFEEAVKRGAPQQAEFRMQRKSGDWLTLQTQILPVLAPEGGVESLVLIARDITETKKLREALAVASINATSSGSIEAMARDFDQILTQALGNLSTAQSLTGSHNAVAVRLSEMERLLQGARDLIEKMFSVSSSGEQPRVRVPLEPVLHEAVASVLRGTMVRAEYTLARNLPELDLNVEGFSHAIRNLITNSLQAMDKGVIRLTAEFISQAKLAEHPEIALRPGNYVCLIIQDQGHGMSDKVLPRAFEPYFTTRKEATGLGLTTALSAIQRMGGTILLHSTPHVGTTAYVYLPAVLPAKPVRAGTMALPKVGGKRRILLMDDEQMILDIVSRMLSHLGYEVTTCSEGAQAIAAFAKAKSTGHPFDVVLMDLVIPNGVGGQDAVHTLRKIDPTARVIASSGHLEHPAMIDHKKFGFVATLEKPYKLERLQQVIEAVVDSAA